MSRTIRVIRPRINAIDAIAYGIFSNVEFRRRQTSLRYWCTQRGIADDLTQHIRGANEDRDETRLSRADCARTDATARRWLESRRCRCYGMRIALKYSGMTTRVRGDAALISRANSSAVARACPRLGAKPYTSQCVGMTSAGSPSARIRRPA